MRIELTPDHMTPVHTRAEYLPDGAVAIRKVDKEQPDENTYLKVC